MSTAKNKKFENLAQRIRAYRDKFGITQEFLASKLGVSRNYVYMIEAGRKPSHTIAELFRMMESSPVSPISPGERGLKPDALRLAALQPHRVPVISWASAGKGGNYSDLAEFLDEFVESDCKDPNAYGLIVEGDSMEPVFRPGDRIIINPNLEARNGDVVVARLGDSGEVLFKLYHLITKDTVRLTSFNPAYPSLEFQRKQFRFIHPIYSMTRKWRR